jgi:hypothetical protein
MPAMVRPSGKAKKIAYAILGVPANMRDKKTSKQEQEDKELVFQETTRVR